MKTLEAHTETSKIVMDNLKSEMKQAVTLEKQNRIRDAALEFGISTNNLEVFKGQLTPTLPKIFRDLKLSGEDIRTQMDDTKKFKLVGSAEIAGWALKSLKEDRWAKEKNCEWQSLNYASLYGNYSE